MKPFFLLSVLSLSLITGLRGDGIPLDRRTMTVVGEHSIIILSDAQQEEIEALGTLTFTPDQWKKLRAFDPNCPKRIETIYEPSYPDSVETDSYVIQMAPDRVAVPHGFNYFPAIEKRYGETWLQVDRRGQFYYERRLIPFQKLLDMLKATAGKPGDATLRLKVPLGLKLDSSVLKTRVARLFTVAQAAGWNIE